MLVRKAAHNAERDAGHVVWIANELGAEVVEADPATKPEMLNGTEVLGW